MEEVAVASRPVRRPRPADVALLGGLAALAVVETLVAPRGPERPLVALAASLALIAPLAARRSRPLLVCWGVALLFALFAATDAIDEDTLTAPSLAALLAIAAAALHAASPAGLALAIAGSVTLASAATGLFADGMPQPGDLLFGIAFVAGAVLLARAVRDGTLRRLRLLVDLDAARGARAAASAAAAHERRRMARELHDVGSHHLVVASLHLSLAAAPDADPAAAREARAVAATALSRAGDALAQVTGARAPLPADGAATLADGLAHARELGASVRAPAPGDAALAAVPAAVALTAARLLQEALTNAAKHAAGGAVTVALTVGGDALALEVRNGAGAAAGVAGGGLGLTGMRERVRLLGGTLRCGPEPDGGWRIAAALPLAPPAARAGLAARIRSGLRAVRVGCPAWAWLIAAALAVWGTLDALGQDGGQRPALAVAAALSACAPPLLWRRPAALTAVALAAIAARGWLGTIPASSSPLVLLVGLVAYAVAHGAPTVRGGVAGVLVLVAALPVSFVLDAVAEPFADLSFLPALVLGAGVAGLLTRLRAADAARLHGELARAREQATAERSRAAREERRRLEAELAGSARGAIGALAGRLAAAERQPPEAARATLTALEQELAATLRELGRLAAVLRRSPADAA